MKINGFYLGIAISMLVYSLFILALILVYSPRDTAIPFLVVASFQFIMALYLGWAFK